ncbi:hypothetical protein MVEN_00036000 [Mycena venus]|uniref:Uncharacterized protein n=1 Tax=Mycena venus TaxID=2733690 RepID=A0A8H6Z392_9AGAR|nr:hypothetical protein MVEN_00036000 [Mycena venus]
MLIRFFRSHGQEAGHRGLTYWQCSEHLFHPSTVQLAPNGSRQTRHGCILLGSMMDVSPTADILLNSAGSRHRAMHSEHVPNASKDRQHLDCSFGFARDGMYLRRVMSSVLLYYTTPDLFFVVSPHSTITRILSMYIFGPSIPSIQRSASRKSPDFSLPLLLYIIG